MASPVQAAEQSIVLCGAASTELAIGSYHLRLSRVTAYGIQIPF